MAVSRARLHGPNLALSSDIATIPAPWFGRSPPEARDEGDHPGSQTTAARTLNPGIMTINPTPTRSILLRRGALALTLTLALAACREGDAARWEDAGGKVTADWQPETVDAVLGVPIDSLRALIATRMDSGSRTDRLSADGWAHVRELYSGYAFVPLWFQGDGLHDRTGNLINALAQAHTDGIRVDAYPIEEMHESLTALRSASRASASMLVDADVLLTSAYVALAEDMYTGQIDPNSIAQSWHVQQQETNVDSALAYTLRLEPLDRGIARMRPQHPDFDALRQSLARYREIVARGAWSTVPEGPSLRPGDTSSVERMRALVARLAAEDYIQAGTRIDPLADSTGQVTDRALYDRQLAGAVATFQSRHAIVLDSILGPGTLASLNLTAEYRLRQIAGNLERFRWMPRQLGDRYVFVNIPAFHLEAFDEGKRVLDMKVIVGSEFNDQATPAFSDSMSYVVFRPYWNVPVNIAVEEILPEAYKDPGYMRRRDYEVVRGWGDNAPVVGQSPPSVAAVRSGQVRVRQRPNPQNSLGNVKFIFPNDFAIYLHDTPAPELFERDIRAFSHGCIRVEAPERLARFALGWDLDRIREAMTTGTPSRQVNLDRKIPVYILYLTTYTRDGDLFFGNDLYQRDEKLTMAMADAAVPTAETTRMVSELRALVAD